jgi:hypothetical protein
LNIGRSRCWGSDLDEPKGMGLGSIRFEWPVMNTDVLQMAEADDREPSEGLLSNIRIENLNVYRASPQRLREDVGQESQIAQDYRGRLVYELLQNADDA